MVNLIEKKRDGKSLTQNEIHFIINGALSKKIPDYQVSAWLMAIFFRGMDSDETACLTEEMINSGVRFDFSSIPGKKVDKHSTGGVGDKISLVIAPIVAAGGVPVPMVSGRGLGHTGGTLDKLESIPGFRTNLSFSESKKLLEKHNLFFIGQTEELCPADRHLYALRDVTGTVESPSLITGSIMSKKIAEGIDALVLDVKVGDGAFMKSLDQAKTLAKMLVETGHKHNVPTEALLTDMSQPLGEAIGNLLEVKEAVDVLRGGGPDDTRFLSLEFASRMFHLGGKVKTLKEGRALAENLITNKKALEKFREVIVAQNGDSGVIDHMEDFFSEMKTIEVPSIKTGFVNKIHCHTLGKFVGSLGAGRTTLAEKIHPRVGVILHKKIGAKIKKGESLMTLYVKEDFDSSQWIQHFQETIHVDKNPVSSPSLILDEVKHV
ncbi:MAG TPA: thymidine phosphorylase [Bdellovibrionota bacterium]|nr:thymidine phosphorylase [Bdellovibrionota bacterium]